MSELTKGQSLSSSTPESPDTEPIAIQRPSRAPGFLHRLSLKTRFIDLTPGRRLAFQYASGTLVVVLLLIGGGLIGKATRDPEVVALKAELSALHDDNAMLDGTVDALQSDVRDSEEKLRVLTAASADKEAALSAREKDLAAAEKTVSDREAAVGATETQKTKQEVRNGVHVVGTTVEPGIYQTPGPASSGMCYYAWKTGTGSDAQIVDNNITQGTATVTLNAGEIFESSMCQTWIKVG